MSPTLRLILQFFLQTEDIRLEPELYEACKSDIKNYCQNVPYGNAQVMEFINNLQFNLYFHFRKLLKNTFAPVSAAQDFHFAFTQIFW